MKLFWMRLESMRRPLAWILGGLVYMPIFKETIDFTLSLSFL
jgi:hypothetical protein